MGELTAPGRRNLRGPERRLATELVLVPNPKDDMGDNKPADQEKLRTPQQPPKVVWGVQVACLLTMIALAWIDASSTDFQVTPQWLLILGGIALGGELAKIRR